MVSRVRVAVLGLGVGQEHLHAYRRLPELYDVVAVCDVDAARAAEAAARWGVDRWCTDPVELLAGAEGAIDVVDVCTPPHLHVEHTTAALDAGCDVICEKPVARSLAELDELHARAVDAGRLLMPVFQYRFGHGVQKLRALVDAGLTGRAFTTTVEVSWRRGVDYYAVPWRGRWATELGGVLLSHGTHALDLLCYVLGRPARVSARVATRVNPIEVDDCAVALVEMEDGSLASVSATLGSAVEISRHRFCFEHLVAESNTSPYRNAAEPWTFATADPEWTTKVEDALARFAGGPQGYAGQLARFHAARRRGEPLPVTIEDARTSLELVSAVYRSAATGREVSLPIAPGDPGYDGWAPETRA